MSAAAVMLEKRIVIGDGPLGARKMCMSAYGGWKVNDALVFFKSRAAEFLYN
jgi:hypothetical protein